MRVGRDALDAEAMRLLEQHNPDVDFDWPRLLKSMSIGSPPPASSASPLTSRDDRRRDRRGRPGEGAASRTPFAGLPSTQEAELAAQEAELTEGADPTPAADFTDGAETSEATDLADFRRGSAAADLSERPDFSEARESVDLSERPDFSENRAAGDRPDRADFRPGTEAADLTERPGFSRSSAAVHVAPPADAMHVTDAPVDAVEPRYARLGADGLTRLRARYADVRARIQARSAEDAERAELLATVERLNPDAWQTEEEVTHALEEYEVVFEALRPLVGRQPRSRRL